MEKSGMTINKINFLLFVNLLALIILVNVSAISLNNELGSLDASIDRVAGEMRLYNESYPTVHLVEFSDLKSSQPSKLQSAISPLADKILTGNNTTYQTAKEVKPCQDASDKDGQLAGKTGDPKAKGFMIDQIALFIIATPVIAFFLLTHPVVGAVINKLTRFFR